MVGIEAHGAQIYILYFEMRFLFENNKTMNRHTHTHIPYTDIHININISNTKQNEEKNIEELEKNAMLLLRMNNG